MFGSNSYDAIVIGVGAMGSATCYQLARRGKRVLGLERFGIPHTKGSSHGYTRIIRLAYYEHPSYVLLLRRAYELWRELQDLAGEQLLFITGSIDAGPPDEWVFKGAWESARLHDLPHEVLTGPEVRRRFPAYHLPAEIMALFQPEGGYLRPERCIVSYVRAAQALGAEIHGHEQVLEWQPRGDGVRVRTDRASYEADRLVVAAGAWGGDLVDCLAGLLVPERQVLAWLQPTRPEYFQPDRFPVFNLLVDEGRFYGFPEFDVPGFKFGKYHHLQEWSPAEEADRAPHEYDEEVLRAFAERYFPDGCGPTMNLETCLFTNTADKHFLIDLHPTYPQVCLASPCSGHGFKFASVIGEILADLAQWGLTRHDLSLFRLERLLPAAGYPLDRARPLGGTRAAPPAAHAAGGREPAPAATHLTAHPAITPPILARPDGAHGTALAPAAVRNHAPGERRPAPLPSGATPTPPRDGRRRFPQPEDIAPPW